MDEHSIQDTENVSAPPKQKVGLVRIGLALSIVQITIYVGWVASANVLLPVQIIAAVGEDNKESWLGIITSLGAFVGMILSPFIGRWSDRTRSKLGKRAPWMLAGAAVLAVGYALMGAITNSISLMVASCLTQAGLTAMIMAANTVLPERVPLKRRGLLSGVTALATTSATLTASFIGAAFVPNPMLGLMVLGTIVIVGAIMFVLIAPMAPSTGEEDTKTREDKFKFAEFFAAFKARNFRWVWIG